MNSGYAGGEKINPSYEEVSSGSTGHAEVIHIEFNPELVGFRDLLEVFFATHDPTTLNRQGADEGTQYRSVILYTTEKQKQEAEKFIEEVTEEKIFQSPIVTEIKPLEKFYEAEQYHKDYYNQNQGKGYCQVVINPKLEKFKKKFSSLMN